MLRGVQYEHPYQLSYGCGKNSYLGTHPFGSPLKRGMFCSFVFCISPRPFLLFNNSPLSCRPNSTEFTSLSPQERAGGQAGPPSTSRVVDLGGEGSEYSNGVAARPRTLTRAPSTLPHLSATLPLLSVDDSSREGRGEV